MGVHDRKKTHVLIIPQVQRSFLPDGIFGLFTLVLSLKYCFWSQLKDCRVLTVFAPGSGTLEKDTKGWQSNDCKMSRNEFDVIMFVEWLRLFALRRFAYGRRL